MPENEDTVTLTYDAHFGPALFWPRPKVDSAVAAIKTGVDKVSFVDGRITHSVLLEIFTDKGIGTEIVL